MEAAPRTQAGAGFRRSDARSIAFGVSPAPVPYRRAEAMMSARAHAIRETGARELIWFLEHPPLYTAGTSADPAELRDPNRFPVFKTGRGGRFTYHGPGQRVAYIMLDLGARKRDVRAFVGAIEASVMAALGALGVQAHTVSDRVGLWIERADGSGEDKIAAIGVRLKRWVSFHGVAINVAPDLSHFAGIVPCGVAEPRFGVTSLAALGVSDAQERFDQALHKALSEQFGPLEAESESAGDALVASVDEAC